MPTDDAPYPRLLAIDWGTSSLRGALLAADGRVLHERSLPRGILSVAPGAFPAVFREVFGDWTGEAGLCLVSGMAGSRQGWRETPYCPCPAGFAELGTQIAWIAGERLPIGLVPGLSCEHAGLPDVMRGEEVQIFGGMQRSGIVDGSFVLPGTHSKWAQVRDGRVTGFRTCMTGEFYAVLSRHSILARTLAADAPFDLAAFVQGVERARLPGGLLHHAFGARTLSLFERMDAGALASYLSGLVNGAELQERPADGGRHVVLVGSPALAERYAVALQVHGIGCTVLGSEATWAGLHGLAATLDGKPMP